MYDDQTSRDIALTRQMLGPQPEKALRVLVDLGLDDCQIGRYHSVPSATVSALRAYYRIASADGIMITADQRIGEMDNNKYLAWILHAFGGSNASPVARPDRKCDTAPPKQRHLVFSARSEGQISSEKFCIQRWDDEGGATHHTTSHRIAV